MLFMLMNRKDSIAPWGISACKDRAGGFYATIIIRIQALEAGVKIAVAVHEFHVTDRVGFNVHTGFQRGGTVALAPCPQDDRAVLNELESTLRKAAEADPAGVPPKGE
jgi:hypothetical protein